MCGNSTTQCSVSDFEMVQLIRGLFIAATVVLAAIANAQEDGYGDHAGYGGGGDPYGGGG